MSRIEVVLLTSRLAMEYLLGDFLIGPIGCCLRPPDASTHEEAIQKSASSALNEMQSMTCCNMFTTSHADRVPLEVLAVDMAVKI